jgi:hypothetical protein
MPGIKDFTTESHSFRNIVTKAASYTVTLSDEMVQINGTYTMTLPPLNSLQGTLFAKKVYAFKNVNTSGLLATIAPGTNTVTAVADTIGGKASLVIRPNETVVITGRDNSTDWLITSPYPIPALRRVPFTVVKTTNGTTAVHIFSSNGAPTDIFVDEILVNALDTIASTITITGGAQTVSAIAKGTTLSAITPATTITYPAVAAGSTFSMVGDGTGDARVTVIGTMQQYV